MIRGVLDSAERWFELAERLIWMPSHTSRGGSSDRLKSDGTKLTAVDWRANRLADANAKAAVLPYLMSWQQVAELRSRNTLVTKIFLRIGKVTHASNHHPGLSWVDGAERNCVLRDSKPERKAYTSTKPTIEQLESSGGPDASTPRLLIAPQGAPG